MDYYPTGLKEQDGCHNCKLCVFTGDPMVMRFNCLSSGEHPELKKRNISPEDVEEAMSHLWEVRWQTVTPVDRENPFLGLSEEEADRLSYSIDNWVKQSQVYPWFICDEWVQKPKKLSAKTTGDTQ